MLTLTLVALVCLVVAACVLTIDAVLALRRPPTASPAPPPTAYRSDARATWLPRERGRVLALALGLVAVAACALGLVPAREAARHRGVVGMSVGTGDVVRGRTAVLRLSGRVRGAEITHDSSGFVATLDGVSSLDHASAIAASSAAVDRATITNGSDRATLDVRFLGGRTPGYRLEVDGDEVRVTIGR